MTDMADANEMRKVVHEVLREQREARNGFDRFLEAATKAMVPLVCAVIIWGVSTEVAIQSMEREIQGIMKSRFTREDGLQLEARLMNNVSSRLDTLVDRINIISEAAIHTKAEVNGIVTDIKELKTAIREHRDMKRD